ncbi:MAG: CinA family protein [Dermatophilaceae bacterium]
MTAPEGPVSPPEGQVSPERVVAALIARGETVATAESLTGGLIIAGLIDVPGSSVAVRGGVVAYHPDLKISLVGVDRAVLGRPGGSVQAEVAAQLARGARERFAATWGIGTTGVAGPDPSDGLPVGTVYVSVAGPLTSDGPSGRTVGLHLSGDRAANRADAVQAALEMLLTELVGDSPQGRSARASGQVARGAGGQVS